MTDIVFFGGNVILPDQILENGVVAVRNGTIAAISTQRSTPSQWPAEASLQVDLQGRYLSPGFVDLHVHGGAGADFMDGTEDAILRACGAHVRHGTTTIFPTTTTGSCEQILAMLDACGTVQNSQTQVAGAPGAASQATTQLPHLAGVHLYGPFFADNKVGCHSQAGRRNPRAEEYDSYFATGLIKIATCAAELPGANQFYRAARAHHCLITCGHSNASWSEMATAYEMGMRHVDHFWCAMSSVASLRQRFNVPMQASMAEFVLMQPEMSTEVIADGYHLAPELLEFAYRMKGARRLCLVTDCNRALDCSPGDYRFGNEHDGSWLRSDGHVGWAPDGQSLASSIVGMGHMVRHMKRSTSARLPEVIRMASLTPAERAGIAEQTGSIEAGKRADLCVLSSDLRVDQVYVAGRLVI